MKMLDKTKCHCGLPLHYSDENTKKQVERLIEKKGWYLPVTVGNKSYLVPRHYIALHGLNAITLDSLGFDQLNE